MMLVLLSFIGLVTAQGISCPPKMPSSFVEVGKVGAGADGPQFSFPASTPSLVQERARKAYVGESGTGCCFFGDDEFMRGAMFCASLRAGDVCASAQAEYELIGSAAQRGQMIDNPDMTPEQNAAEARRIRDLIATVRRCATPRNAPRAGARTVESPQQKCERERLSDCKRAEEIQRRGRGTDLIFACASQCDEKGARFNPSGGDF